MNEEPKHQRITQRIPQPDGSVRIVIKSYYERLAHVEESVEKKYQTSRKTYLQDVITISEHILRENAKELNIRVRGEHGEPKQIIAEWTVLKQSLNRK